MIKNKICPNCNSDIHTYGIFTDENKIIIRCLNCNFESLPQRYDEEIKTLIEIKEQWR